MDVSYTTFPATYFEHVWVKSQTKIVQETQPLLALHSPKSCTEAITCIPQNCHIHHSGEWNGAHRRSRISFGRTVIKALKLLH